MRSNRIGRTKNRQASVMLVGFLLVQYYLFTKTRWRPSTPFTNQYAIKKIFSAVLRMNSNSYINHGESRVYHQFRRNCISSKRSFVYHHCEKKCSLRLMIYTFGDEVHACAWWYTIAFAMDKKSTGRNLSIFGRSDRTWTCGLMLPNKNYSLFCLVNALFSPIFTLLRAVFPR